MTGKPTESRLIQAYIDPRLFTAPAPTIRTWLLLLILSRASGWEPVMCTAKGLAGFSKKRFPLSRAAVGKALKELSEYGMICVERSAGLSRVTVRREP